MALILTYAVLTTLVSLSYILCHHSCIGCYVFPPDARDPCRDKRCSFGAQCVPSLDGLTARCQCPERCDNYGDSVDSTPLCATDGRNYANRCEMRRAACSEMKDIEKKYDGKCDPCDGFQCPVGQLCTLDEHRRPLCQCNTICSRDLSPVCASDGRTYSNECMMQSEACKNHRELRVAHRGECSPGDELQAVGDEHNSRASPCALVKCATGETCHVDRSGRPRCSCPAPCEKVVRQVCGSDGITYDNECDLRRKACFDKRVITVTHVGQCHSRRKSRSKDTTKISQISHSTIERPVAFTGKTYLLYKSAIDKQVRRQQQTAYEMSFRTNLAAGLLLIEHKSRTVHRDFVAIAINNGRVEASFNLGYERTNVPVTVRSNINVHDGFWHNLLFTRNGNTALLSVDDETPVNVTATTGATSLNTDGMLWIGGPGKGPLIGLPKAYDGGLVGCIQHVRLNKRRLDLVKDLQQDSTVLFCSSHE